MNQYIAFGLSVFSEVRLPELLQVSENYQHTDVHISVGHVSESGIFDAVQVTPFFQARTNAFWLRIDNVARFLIKDGSQIIIDPAPGADDKSIRSYLLGSCFGALLMQRGFYLIHGNAIQIGEEAISFAGFSGAGKSSMTALLKNRGFQVLADDICAINDKGEVMPSYPQIKLWADMTDFLGIDTKGLNRICPHLEKFALPIHQAFCQRKKRLSRLYIISSQHQNHITIENVCGADKIKHLKTHTYRPQFLDALGLTASHAIKSLDMASKISIKKLIRPACKTHIHNMLDAIEADISSLKKISCCPTHKIL